MNATQFCLILKKWLCNLISIRSGTVLLNLFGALWLCIEIANYFFPETQLAIILPRTWWVFLTMGIFIAVAIAFPKFRMSHKLKGRDVTIEIAVGNIFEFPGTLVIGSNTTFDTEISEQLISENSIQGQYSKRYYSDEKQLNREIESQLENIPGETLSGNRVGKNIRYPMGTVVRLNPRGSAAYFLAIAHVNEHGVASSKYEDLQDSLAKLWVFIGEHGSKDSIVMPVMGTGYGRLIQPREEVVQEIVKSFVAACADMVFCDKLTIVLYSRDVERHQISFEKLNEYVKYVCDYTEFTSSDGSRRGHAVEYAIPYPSDSVLGNGDVAQ